MCDSSQKIAQAFRDFLCKSISIGGAVSICANRQQIGGGKEIFQSFGNAEVTGRYSQRFGGPNNSGGVPGGPQIEVG